MPQAVIQRGFAGGELAPVFHSRADTAQYLHGLRTCRNFLVRREGGVSNRPGFRFVEACKVTTAGTRLLPFLPASGSGIVIEAGQGYFRFIRNGAQVTVTGVAAYSGATPYVPGDLVISSSVIYYCHAATTGNAPPNASFWYALTMLSATVGIYEIPTPWDLDEIPDWSQASNVLTLTNVAQAPRELTYGGITAWVLGVITTGPSTSTVQNVSATAGVAGSRTMNYIVTAAGADSFEESNPSTPYVLGSTGQPTEDNPNAVSWDALAGAEEYYVYCDRFDNGVYGFVGTAASNSFNDIGDPPDFNLTPPIPRALFGSANNFPAHSTSYQQRRVFGRTNAVPDGVWASRVGFPSNFGITSPLQDDDALTFRLAGSNNAAVQALFGLRTGLIVMTRSGEWTVGRELEALTPNNLPTAQETYNGIADGVRPEVIGNSLIYVQGRGNIVRGLHFDERVQGLAGEDLSIFASHLFRSQVVSRLAYQQSPDSILWVVRNDGVLLGLTYVREQGVMAWHRHDTRGAVEDIVVVPESDEDVLYAVISRTIGGSTVRYIERLESRDINETNFDAEVFFVDSGLSYSGVPANTFGGLDHLEGEVVAIVADGSVVYDGDPNGAEAATYTVTGGTVGPIPSLATNVHIGLRIDVAEIETLDLDVAGTAIRDRRKRVSQLQVLVERSSRGFQAGQDENTLRTYEPQAWEATGDEFTGQLELSVESSFSLAGRVKVRQPQPLPLTILGIIPVIEAGD